MSILDYKYEFTVYDTLRKTCDEKKSGGGKGKKYPDEHSLDIGLDMTVKNSKGQTGWGYASPLYVDGDRIHSSVVNISYELHFRHGFNFFGQGSLATTKVSAEGIYDRENGNLCMIACRHVLSKDQNLIEKDMLDCGMKINLQFSPLDATDRRSVNGTIESTRRKSDPLYFEPMELSSISITKYQAANSISRINLENVMVLISNTLACVFVGWQLYYVKKHPGVLPFISIVMCFVLILGYMIPLLSNFGAMFVPNRSWQDKFLGTATASPTNLVLETGEGSLKGLMDSERKVLYATLPLYIAGALITWLVHPSMDTHHSSYRPFHGLLNHGNHLPVHLFRHQHTLWDDLKSYAGFVLDGFLLPQILLNLFFNSGEKALAISYYFGTTMIRLLPHAYDLYRAHTYPWVHAFKNIYANPGSDFYSTAWNVIIPCGGLLFAAIVFLQQKFGGRCILPKRFTDLV
ncbi:hypothetical protein M0R45_002581 [Rubus argutus]|uniref:RING-type E3 ubiquitin transferase n=2 Tax=Rubus argutus TaxID=59490 RepID=A0AAW1VPK8_RUBAR